MVLDYCLSAAAGVSLGYVLRYFVGRAERYITPAVIHETSRFSTVKHPIRALSKLVKTQSADEPHQDISVLTTQLEERLQRIAIDTKNRKRNREVYKNLLLQGPSETGKMIFSKRLAECCEMDYALTSGHHLAYLGRHDLKNVRDLFDWASTSRKGLVLMIDDVDAFFCQCSSEHAREYQREMWKVFQQCTNKESNKFMLIFASTIPEQSCWTINDRLYERIEFALPSREEREQLVRAFFDKHVLQPASAGQFKVAQFDYDAMLKKVADITDGLTRRQISFLGSYWRAVGLYRASLGDVLTEQILIEKCIQHAEQYK